jgi:pyruvate/2-oxoglutarate dehydrogenase complex dihydrolipoamide dehydrogenase (E3) component
MKEGILPNLDRLGLSQNVLSGEVVVVTGSGRGIGREMAFTFARLGAMVVIAELSEAEFAKLPVFVRPLAKNGFKGKAGMSLGEWKQFKPAWLKIFEQTIPMKANT